MDLDAHFFRIKPLIDLERRLLRDFAAKPEALTRQEIAVLRYALALARMGWIRSGEHDIDVFEVVAPFRHWLVEQLDLVARPERAGSTDFKGVHRLVRTIRGRIRDVRARLLDREAARLGEERLERELTERALVLVLGGGGGSGYSHLGAFATIAELGLAPRLIVGSSMGALMGLYRAVNRDWDPMAVTLALPRPSEFGRVFSPYRGYSRFGFPGALEMKMRAAAAEIFPNLLGRDIPRFSELPIPLRIVATGLRTGIGLAISEVEERIGRSFVGFSPLRIRRRVSLFTGVLRQMLERPRFLSEVLFGGDEGLRDFDTIDAVGFSCSVPALLHYDVYSERESVETLRALFAERQLFRLTDGGVISNVASRAAWQCVQQGEIRTRNAFVLAFDAFAPLPNTNALFYPVQRLVKSSVDEQRAYADYHVMYSAPPLPVQLLKSYDALQTVTARVRQQLAGIRDFLALALRPLPPWPSLDAGAPVP